MPKASVSQNLLRLHFNADRIVRSRTEDTVADRVLRAQFFAFSFSLFKLRGFCAGEFGQKSRWSSGAVMQLEVRRSGSLGERMDKPAGMVSDCVVNFSESTGSLEEVSRGSDFDWDL